MKSLGISSSKIMNCVEERGEELIAEHAGRAQEYGVTGSPTLIINGVRANTARNAEAYKTAVCSAFNEAPTECSETLDSSSDASAGNC
jgi:predicted DsbA family dithiol-disulfide isomerase